MQILPGKVIMGNHYEEFYPDYDEAHGMVVRLFCREVAK